MSAHKQRYKNVGLDSNEMRRRREEEGIQLRKQKREQQLIKRRNVENLPTMDSENEVSITVSVTRLCACDLRWRANFNWELCTCRKSTSIHRIR